MSLTINIPEPALWILGTILVLALLRFLANLILPGND